MKHQSNHTVYPYRGKLNLQMKVRNHNGRCRWNMGLCQCFKLARRVQDWILWQTLFQYLLKLSTNQCANTYTSSCKLVDNKAQERSKQTLIVLPSDAGNALKQTETNKAFPFRSNSQQLSRLQRDNTGDEQVPILASQITKELAVSIICIGIPQQGWQLYISAWAKTVDKIGGLVVLD